MKNLIFSQFHSAKIDKYLVSNFIATFRDSFSESEGEQEGKLIAELAHALITGTNSEDIYAFSATKNNEIVGAIICSRLLFEKPINCFILGPVAVLPNFQNQGIGKALINFGKKQLTSEGVELLFTYGDPNFYRKLGFQPVSETQIAAPYPLSMPIGWLAQSLNQQGLPQIHGQAQCVKALNNPQYW